MEALSNLSGRARKVVKALVMPVYRARFRHEMRVFRLPYKLHLGCGYHHLADWANIDFIRTPAANVWWNLGSPIPLPDSSCRYIFHEHVLEHFELSRGLNLLQECYRLLEPGGVLRVAMPSLDDMLENCETGKWRNTGSAHMPEVETRSEYLNVMFRHWGHRWIYDHDELQRRLHEVGFTDISNAELRESAHPELHGIEYRDDSLLICEAVKAENHKVAQ